MSTTFTEPVVEQAALVWFESVGWRVRNGDEIAPGTVQPALKLANSRALN